MELIKRLGMRFPKASIKHKQNYGLFLCPYCKKEVERNISSGLRCKSCGCAWGLLIGESNKKLKTIHGYRWSRIYRIHQTMIGRCYCRSNGAYDKYGNCGILVCKEWKKSFMVFKDWAFSNGYKDNLQIDRIDNDGNYCPENCRWVTCAQNCQNRRSNVFDWSIITKIRTDYKTKQFLQKDLAKKYNTSKQNISDIVNNKTWKEEVSHAF